MRGKLSRRKRRIIITTTAILLFIAVTLIVVWLHSSTKKPYVPGEKIEGLTAELSRTIPEDYPRVTFRDATAEAGISFRHFTGTRTVQLPEDMGSGAAWGDYDNDGWLDLFVVNEVGPLNMTEEEIKNSPAHCALYHNKGDGTFEEVSAAAGVDYRGWGMAAAWIDYDNNGLPDLFITCYGRNVFYRNNGDGTFTDITRQAGLDQPQGFWTDVSPADFDRDGFLDIYVCGYVKYSNEGDQTLTLQYEVETPASINPSSFDPERNLLFHNKGDGTFSEIARKAGVDNPDGRSLSAAWCDFDEDGWLDLYVANDVSDNVMYHNLGNGTFEEVSLSAWVADYRGAMGLAVGDWDSDTDMDLFITHWIAQENALYNNLRTQFDSLGVAVKGMRFMDEADRYGLGQIALDYIGWGTSFFDYDNDGRLDLFVTNGSTLQQPENSSLLIPMTNLLFWNKGKKKGFYNVSVVSGEVFQRKLVGRGAAFGDYDNDGDIDIFLVSNDGPAVLLRNEGGNRNNWLDVRLEGRKSNRQALGTRLKLYLGNRVQIRQTGAQSSYCSQNSPVVHFGLGNAATVDSLEILWLSGTHQVLRNVPANRVIHIVENKGAV